MDILNIQLEEQLLMKYCMLKHLILLKIPNRIKINADLLQWTVIFLIKKTSGGATTLANKSAVKNENLSNKKNYTNQLLKNSRKEKYAHLLKTIFVVLILLICN